MSRIVCAAGEALTTLFVRRRRSYQPERVDLADIYRIRARNCRELSARVSNRAAASALLALAAEHEADAARLSYAEGEELQSLERGF